MELTQEIYFLDALHVRMREELQRHHDEKADDWAHMDPHYLKEQVAVQMDLFRSTNNPKHLVHAANFLMIMYTRCEIRAQWPSNDPHDWYPYHPHDHDEKWDEGDPTSNY